MSKNQLKTIITQLMTTVSIAAGLHSWHMTHTQMQSLESQMKLDKATQTFTKATTEFNTYLNQVQVRDSKLNTVLELLMLNLEENNAKLMEHGKKLSEGQDVAYHLEKIQECLKAQTDITREASSYLNMPKEEFEQIVQESFKTAEESKEILESNVLSPIVDNLNQLKEFLSTLTVEQHACFVNGLGFLLVFLTLNSLVSAYFGNHIISYFSLETRLPRLAKYIEYRVKFMNFFFIFNIVFLYFLTIFYIIVNLFFFFN